MVALTSITLLILAAAVMLVIRVFRPRFGYYWLIAAGGGLISWGMVFGLGLMLPIELELNTWNLAGFTSHTILLLIDRISWPFGVGVVTILFGAILTDVVRAVEIEWSNWASSLLMTSLGLIAIFAANLLTFVLIWTAVDIIGFVLLVMQENRSGARRRLVIRLLAQLLGTTCLLLAGLISPANAAESSLRVTSSAAIPLIVITAILRLGSVPESTPVIEKPEHRRSFGTVMRLLYSGMISLFLVRTTLGWSQVIISAPMWLLIIGLLAAVALLSGVSWLLSGNELEGRQSFLTAMLAIVIFSVLRSQSEAGMAWGLAVMFSGGLLFLASVRTKFSMWLTLIGVLGLSALPYTPAWNSLQIFSAPLRFSFVFFFTAMVLLIWGYFRHASVEVPYPDGIERWIKVVYPIGLFILPVSHFILGLMMRPDIKEVPVSGWVLGIVVLLLSILGFYWQKRGGKFPGLVGRSIQRIITLDWLFTLTRILFSLMERLINFITHVLEGEGGFLWVLLWIVLFLAVLLINIGT